MALIRGRQGCRLDGVDDGQESNRARISRDARTSGGPEARLAASLRSSGSVGGPLVAGHARLPGDRGAAGMQLGGATGRNPIEQKSTGPNLRPQDQGDIGNHLLIGGFGQAFPLNAHVGQVIMWRIPCMILEPCKNIFFRLIK